MRLIAPGRWQRVSIEFEFESRNFPQTGEVPQTIVTSHRLLASQLARLPAPSGNQTLRVIESMRKAENTQKFRYLYGVPAALLPLP